MDLKQLHSLGAFVSDRPVKRIVEFRRPVPKPESEWAEPDVPEFTGDFEQVSMDVFIKRISSADDVAMLKEDRSERLHSMVQRLVVDEDGNRVFDSIEQTKQLADWLFFPLAEKVQEVAVHAPKKQASIPETPSGSKSRSRSVAAPRRSGKKR